MTGEIDPSKLGKRNNILLNDGAFRLIALKIIKRFKIKKKKGLNGMNAKLKEKAIRKLMGIDFRIGDIVICTQDEHPGGVKIWGAEKGRLSKVVYSDSIGMHSNFRISATLGGRFPNGIFQTKKNYELYFSDEDYED